MRKKAATKQSSAKRPSHYVRDGQGQQSVGHVSNVTGKARKAVTLKVMTYRQAKTKRGRAQDAADESAVAR